MAVDCTDRYHVFMMLFVTFVPWQGLCEKNTEFCQVFLLKPCSRDMFFPFSLQEHVPTHMIHITEFGVDVKIASFVSYLRKKSSLYYIYIYLYFLLQMNGLNL